MYANAASPDDLLSADKAAATLGLTDDAEVMTTRQAAVARLGVGS